MHFMVVSCEKMHMAFILVPDGLIWHSSPTSGPRRYATRARCWWLMPDEAIWHSNECHMHIMRPPRLSVLDQHIATINEMPTVTWCLKKPSGDSGLQLNAYWSFRSITVYTPNCMHFPGNNVLRNTADWTKCVFDESGYKPNHLVLNWLDTCQLLYCNHQEVAKTITPNDHQASFMWFWPLRCILSFHFTGNKTDNP